MKFRGVLICLMVLFVICFVGVEGNDLIGVMIGIGIISLEMFFKCVLVMSFCKRFRL